MSSVLDSFVDDPSVEGLDAMKREELINLAKHYKLSYKTSMRKQEIKNIVIEGLVDEHVLPYDALDCIMETSDAYKLKKLELDHELQKEKVRMQQEHDFELQKEKIRMEQVLEKEKIEAQIRLKEIELASQPKPIVKAEGDIFDASKNIRLVPKFTEKNVDKYFANFEKVAANLKWPKDVWATLLQSVLIGKAAEVYTSLSLEQSVKYDVVKEAILKAYELVPEAYRQKFRSYRKFESQTHVEFAREKTELFDRWLASKNVNKSFDKLRELILLEEFKQGIHVDIRTHIDHKGAESLSEAATMADNYALTSKQNFVKKSVVGSHSVGQTNSLSYPIKAITSKVNKSEGNGVKDVTPLKGVDTKSEPTCSYCKKKGHIISECFKLQRKNEKGVKPEGCYVKQNENVNLGNSGVGVNVKPPEVHSHSASSGYMEDFKPFISEGFVCMSQNATPLPVKILRDTGASQTLL